MRALPLGVLLLLAGPSACTDGASTVPEVPEASPPSPTPAAPIGAHVGVVLPPTSELDTAAVASIESGLARLSATSDGTALELRGYATADPRFVEDTARWLAERDTAMVCVLGDRAEEVAVTLARLHRGPRFCALPAEPPPPPEEAGTTPVGDGVARVDVRVEELGHLVGVAARTQAGDGAVGLVLGGDELPDDRFREGLLAGLTGAEVVEAEVPSGRTTTLAERADAVLAAGAEVVVIDGGRGATEAVAAVGDRAEVLAPTSVLVDAASTQVALRWSVRWDLALTGPLDALAGDRDLVVHTSVGLENEVFEVTVGAGASTMTARALETTTADLRAGTLDPSVPAPPAPALDDDPDDPDPDDPDDPDPA